MKRERERERGRKKINMGVVLLTSSELDENRTIFSTELFSEQNYLQNEQEMMTIESRE